MQAARLEQRAALLNHQAAMMSAAGSAGALPPAFMPAYTTGPFAAAAVAPPHPATGHLMQTSFLLPFATPATVISQEVEDLKLRARLSDRPASPIDQKEADMMAAYHAQRGVLQATIRRHAHSRSSSLQRSPRAFDLPDLHPLRSRSPSEEAMFAENQRLHHANMKLAGEAAQMRDALHSMATDHEDRRGSQSTNASPRVEEPKEEPSSTPPRGKGVTFAGSPCSAATAEECEVSPNMYHISPLSTERKAGARARRHEFEDSPSSPDALDLDQMRG